MPGSIWDATRILFREGTLPQGNTRAMNGRICWRWNVVGGPGHDDACPAMMPKSAIKKCAARTHD